MHTLFNAPTVRIDRPVPMAEARTLLIIDAANLAAKAHAMFGGALSDDGTPSGHIFGALKMIQSAFRNHRSGPTAVIVCFEGWAADRRLLLPGYKMHRGTPESNIRNEQFAAMLLLPVQAALAPHGEADDAVYELVQRMQPTQRAVVLSSDRDLWQLISDRHPRVKIALSGNRNDYADTELCLRKFGVKPNQIPLYKGLYGDASDGIPKVPRIPKKALDHGLCGATTVEDWLASTSTERSVLQAKALTLECIEQAKTAQQVATLIRQPEMLLYQGGDRSGFQAMCERYSIKTLEDWF